MKYDSTKDTGNLLSIFSSEQYSINEEELKSNLQKVVEYYSKHERHQYHVISRYVNEKLDKGEDSISYILNNIDGMLAFLKYRYAECDKIVKQKANDLDVGKIILDLEKLYDHIALEEERIKNNAIIINDSNQQIQQNVIGTFNSIMNNFQNKVDEISNSLNANIITVVGLFSAIIFVFFGGITSLSDAINGIWEIETKEELTIPLIIILFIGFVIFNTVFLLLYSISKIVDKNIGTSVSGNSARFYWVEEIQEGCFAVCWGDGPVSKCFRNREKAEKIAHRKRTLSNIKSFWGQIVKRIFLRFPYLIVINSIFVLGIVYLYSRI